MCLNPADRRADVVFDTFNVPADSVTPLPGHEGLQHCHALFGKVVLPNNMLQCLEMTGDHMHRLHLFLTLRNQENG